MKKRLEPRHPLAGFMQPMYRQAKKLKPINIFDLDGDGVPNRRDCQPLNPRRQDFKWRHFIDKDGIEEWIYDTPDRRKMLIITLWREDRYGSIYWNVSGTVMPRSALDPPLVEDVFYSKAEAMRKIRELKNTLPIKEMMGTI